MAITDEEMDELAKRVEERQSRANILQPVQAIPMTVKIILAVGLSALFFFSDQLGLTNTHKVIIIAVALLAFFAMGSQPVERGLIPEQEIVAIANKQLVYKMKHGLHAGYRQIGDPNAIIRVHLQGKLERDEWAGEPLYWEHGFSIVSRDGTKEFHGSILNDPRSGMCLGIIDRPEGYSGREEPEKIILTSSDLKKSLAARRLEYGMRINE